jgi:hypothetical protein
VEATPNRSQLVGSVAVVQRWTILKVKGIAERREHPMAQATFGIFDWIDRGNTPLQQLYEERLQLLEAAGSWVNSSALEEPLKKSSEFVWSSSVT